MDSSTAAQQLRHLTSDVIEAPYQIWHQNLQVLVAFFRENPVLLQTILPELEMPAKDFEKWHTDFLSTGGSMVGSKRYSIPTSSRERAALYFTLLERFASGEVDHEDFAIDAFGKTKYAEIVAVLNSSFVTPLARYVQERLANISDPHPATRIREGRPVGEHVGKRVFVVHGHDERIKEQVARFLERGGLEAVILHEQANAGGTIIEKFERHAAVDFAVVLLTPDDVGAAHADSDNLRDRARQNVVLELGYFLGALGRKHVCALYVPGVELPSDIQGLLYVRLDNEGGWKSQLFKELRQAGLQFDLERAL